MIVLKETQDAALKALQSVADIVERRPASLFMAIVMTAVGLTGSIRRFAANRACDASKRDQIDTEISRVIRIQKVAKVNIFRPIGFFSSMKTNLRNAP